MYRISKISLNGTSLKGYVILSYKQLYEHFGEPNAQQSLDGKVSTCWVFNGPDNECVTLYDYKETNLYSRELPSVDDFRNQPIYEWHVGARTKAEADAFISWLKNEIKG